MTKKKEEGAPFTISKHYMLPGVFFALFIRWCVAAYPYSGFNKPPMFGDYEAQRHWQEITVHTPLKDWYRNTTQNDLQYWGLDYPPLSAYHSYIIGIVGAWFDPESIRLFASRGYENEKHKTFMRWTVILSDLYIYFPIVLCLCLDRERIKPKEVKNAHIRTDLAMILFLLYPGLILIDHGHFQYNCVSLGLFLWATFFVVAIECESLASLCFTIALCYKQMELYHALPFFFYLLRLCFVPLMYKTKFVSFIYRLNRIVIALVSIFIIIWFPFLADFEGFKQVFVRLFPFNRGIFEDKVSNVWCAFNVLIKLKTVYTHTEMARTCLLATTAAALPSCLDLFFRCSKNKFVLSLINVSLAFFLFSFQVHEKSILLVAIPVALYLPSDPFICFWFLLVSNFSMLPLLIKDGLLIPFVGTTMIYVVAYSIILKMADQNTRFFSIFSAYRVYKAIRPNNIKKSVYFNVLSTNFLLSCLGMVVLTFAAVYMKPLPRFPDLLPLLISVYSCVHFVIFFIYFNRLQFSLPPTLPLFQKVKLN